MTDIVQLRESIKEHIQNTSSHKKIYELFSLLHYPQGVLFSPSSTRKKDAFDFNKDDIERIREIYSILSFGEGLTKGDRLPIFLIESTTLIPSFIRSVTRKFADANIQFLLIFTVDYSEFVFVVPDYEKKEVGESKLVITKLVIEKEEIHYTDVEILSNLFFEDEKNWRDVWKKWKKAFSVERVTKNFFEDYKKIFFKLRDYISNQKISRKDAHAFTLQLLNRIMFIYFISKKNWLGNKRFINWLWNEYKITHMKNLFYDKWLKQIFFKAFNNRGNELEGLPSTVKNLIIDAPFLNGGLFTKNEFDELLISIDDNLMREMIFDFFEKYNFTIKEDMPLDKEVAVDPQMIGYVYESLANVAEEIYDRTDLGIFYTPKIEVHFMCGRALVEYLHKHMSNIPKENFYHLVFDLPEERDKVEQYFEKERQWDRLEECLDNLSVVDPACGSGAFLVGMLNILTDIYKLIYKHRKTSLTDFELKTRIIAKSLYGVDVMSWAIQASELRLWLQLIVGTEFKKEELRRHALLPNLNMNLRVGDSLVQEIGGINLHLRNTNISEKTKRKLMVLKNEKEKYFNNDPTAKFKTIEEMAKEELRIFNEIIDEKVQSLTQEKSRIEQAIIKLRNTKQENLFGKIAEGVQKKILDDKEHKIKVLERIEKEINELSKIQDGLEKPEKKPFVWDIDFAEIFGDKGGFDIVIGNPPYVRQEKISPPNKTKSEVTKEDRQEYKGKLIKSVQNLFHMIDDIDRKSDYYIYFYFHGLSLLNKKGSFCFITSNSWLDVDFGKNLQEFLLKYVPIIEIFDNPKRSFEHADVNTIIVILGSPVFDEEKIGDLTITRTNNWPMLKYTAKFVMFKKAYELVVNVQNLINIYNVKVVTKGVNITEQVNNIVNTNDYRIFPLLQGDLLEDGWEYPDDFDKRKERFKTGSYDGNKWGGKYLRAPDIFYKVLEKGKGKLIKLEQVSPVKTGYKTGANDFFYLERINKSAKNGFLYLQNGNGWEGEIELTYLRPIIKSPKDSDYLIIDPGKLKLMVFICNKEKSELKNTKALEYINWGETAEVTIKFGADKGKKVIGYQNLQTLKNKKLWYSLIEKTGNTFWVKETNDRLGCFISRKDMICDCRLYYNKSSTELQNYVNSTLMAFFSEILSRSGLGEGAKSLMVYEVNKFLILNPLDCIRDKFLFRNRELFSIFEECGIDPKKPIREQNPEPLSDRAELDLLIFNELGLIKEEQKEIYWSVCELVKQRLEKASSLKKGS